MWREYHAATSHSPESLRRSTHTLDWANMPDPFRHYQGLPVLDLPADPPAPHVPALHVLLGGSGQPVLHDGAGFLSQLLFYSAAISAAKKVPSTGYKYALRVNPSSGNLHPTEFHFITRGLKHWPDGLYHYRASSHMAEQRAAGDFTEALPEFESPVAFILTSILWREAWKYGERAYRYCLHDTGHAWQALALAACAIGCESRAVARFDDERLARSLQLHHDEHPMLIVGVEGSVPTSPSSPGETVWFGGQANPISDHEIEYPIMQQMHQACKQLHSGKGRSFPEPLRAGPLTTLPPPARSERPFGEVVRTRRSALDFTGGTMSLPQLSAILAAASKALPADFASQSFIRLYLYVHRVLGLEPGVYRYWPEGCQLELIRSGDQRVIAAALSLQQELAGNACVAFSMIAGLERAASIYGDRGYRYAHFEAGAIGHRLYLAAGALGLQATGIGAFFDKDVQRYLDLTPEQGEVIYHFAIGHAVPDPRLEA